MHLNFGERDAELPLGVNYIFRSSSSFSRAPRDTLCGEIHYDSEVNVTARVTRLFVQYVTKFLSLSSPL